MLYQHFDGYTIIQGHLVFCMEFEANLSYMRPCLNNPLLGLFFKVIPGLDLSRIAQ